MVLNSVPAPFAPSDQIVDEARNGRMVIVVSSGPYGTRGDLVFPAQMVTPQVINFMARYGKGLVCLALSEERFRQLGFPLLPKSKHSKFSGDLAVSVEAKTGVSTGISAMDRARTITVTVDAAHGADELVTPGHVFPLIARPGGVLARPEPAEAAVDIAHLAGLRPAGVICTVLQDDGEVASLDFLLALGQRFGLKIGTIEDLVAYRSDTESFLVGAQEIGTASLVGRRWEVHSYSDRRSPVQVSLGARLT
jgi:3,4-dihydroxy 2-butanone 4-phosphate synthase / GTP cyclohydrolase II